LQSDASSIEDWEVWGDPREVERRRAERARERLPRDDRVGLIAAEMAQARAEAAAAKAAGNKDKQKACGQLIGLLRQEMQELGIGDAELEAAMPAAQPAPASGAAAGEAAAAGTQQGAAEEAAGSDEAHPPGGCEPKAAASDGGGQEAAAGAAGSDDEDGAGLGFDLFGDGSALEEAEVVKARKSRAQLIAAAAAVQPWGTAGTAGGKKKGKQGGGKPQPPKVEEQQPKALLQQHCQRSGWAAPRFERLPHGGMRLAGGGYRYSVSVDAGGGKVPRKRQQQVQQGPRTFGLREAEDGWERIEEAQNAAATRALFELAASDAQLQEASPPVWAQLPRTFQDLWLAWQAGEGEEEAAASAAAETEEAAAAREAFVRRLLEQAEAQRAVQSRQEVDGAAARREEEARGWQEQLLAAIVAASGSEEQRSQRAEAQQRQSERLAEEQRAWRGSEEGRRWLADRAK
jgi:ATP-dependent RNA helicase DHX29